MNRMTKTIAAAVLTLGLVSSGAVAANAATITLTFDTQAQCLATRANYAAQGYYTTICRTVDLGGGMYKPGFRYTTR